MAHTVTMFVYANFDLRSSGNPSGRAEPKWCRHVLRMQIDNLQEGQSRARDIAYILTRRDNAYLGDVENFKITQIVTSYDEPEESTNLN